MTTKQVLVSHLASMFVLVALAAAIPLAGAVASRLAEVAQVELAAVAVR